MEKEVPYKFISENDKEFEATSGKEYLYLHRVYTQVRMKITVCTTEGVGTAANIK